MYKYFSYKNYCLIHARARVCVCVCRDKIQFLFSYFCFFNNLLEQVPRIHLLINIYLRKRVPTSLHQYLCKP